MKTTYGNIYVMFGEVQQLGSLYKLRTQDLPIQASAKLRNIIRKITPFYEDILEERNRLVKDLGKDDGNGPEIKYGTPEAAEFEQQFGELMRTEIEIDIHPIKVHELGNKANVSELDLAMLKPILDLEE